MARYIILKRDINQPKTPKMVPADKDDLTFMEKIQDEPLVEVYLERRDCEDYYMDPVSKELQYPIKLISIQGFPFYLKPGANKVPASVYEFIQQCSQDKQDGEKRNEALMKQYLQGPLQIL